MDTLGLYKGLEDGLNQKFEMERMNTFLSNDVRKAEDLAGKDAFTRFQSLSQTAQERTEIDVMLSNIKLGRFKVEDKDVAIAKLEAVQGRNLAHLMMNDHKLTGDRREMRTVKERLATLESALTTVSMAPLTEDDARHIEELYGSAMEACQTYIENKNPWYSTGIRRKKKVIATLKRLTRERDAIRVGRNFISEGGEDLKDIKSGVQLLSFAALKQFTRRNKYQMEVDKELQAENELEKLKGEADILKKQLEDYENDEENLEFERISEEKRKQYGWNIFGLGSDKEYKEALDKKTARDKEFGIADKKAQIEGLRERIRTIEVDKWNRDREKSQKEKTDREDIAARRASEMEKKGEAFDALPEKLRPIVSVLSKGAGPSMLFAGKKKLGDDDQKLIRDFIRLREELKNMRRDRENAKTVRIGDQFVCFYQDKNGNINIEAGTGSYPVPFSADQIMNVIAADIIKNEKIYGRGAIIDVINDQKTDLSNMDAGELLHSREYAVEVLSERFNVSKSKLNNLKVGDLKRWAKRILDAEKVDKALLDDFNKFVDLENESMKKDTINTVVNLELLKLGDTSKDRVVIAEQKKEEADNGQQWTPEEKRVHDLVCDLIFSKETWVSDDKQMDRGAKIKKLLMTHKRAISIIVSDQYRDKKKYPVGIIHRMLDKLPLFVLSKDEVSSIRDALADVLDDLKDRVDKALIEQYGREKAQEYFEDMENAGKVELKIGEFIEGLKGKELDEVLDMEAGINDAVSRAMDSVQETFEDCVDELFTADEKETVKKNKKEEEGIDKERDKAAQAEEDKNKAQLDRATERYKELQQQLEESTKNLDAAKAELDETQEDLEDYKNQVEGMQKIISDMKRGFSKLSAAEKDKQREANEEAIAKYKDKINSTKISIYNTKNALTGAKERYKQAKAVDEGNQNNMMLAKNNMDQAAKRYRMGIIKRRVDTRTEVENFYENIIKENKRISDRIKKKAFEDRTQEEKQQFDEAEKKIEGARKKLDNFRERTGKELNKTIEDSTKGKQGQGLFIKNVMKSYFMSMPVLDQRAMLASAIRNCKPVNNLNRINAGALTDSQKIDMMSDLLGGMFKGAGPLFQKMMQGVPTQGLSMGLKKAIEDTQDNLAPIPEEVVKAQMNGIISRSEGRITKIEVVKSLGAASVGQAFMCKVYGPEMENGKDMVVKLLRPDVRNHMMREKKVMLDAARKTDEEGKNQIEIKLMREKNQIGGMEATYLGNLQRIEEELDLTIEAANCEKGKIYDNKIKGRKDNRCTSMKMSDLVDPTGDSCMMEIAGTKTVKRYMSELNETARELAKPFAEMTFSGTERVPKLDEDGFYVLKDGNFPYKDRSKIAEAIKKMEAMIEEGDKKRLALGELAEKWVSEGVFENGYYHGDLHAGNIMINENGVAVIDFGNATTLTENQQKHISRMMVAATIGDVDMFRNGFHELLENTPEEVYQEKRDELTLVFKDVMTMGDQSKPAERIAVALIKAQEIGLELPPTIANFSSCQIRLQNTLNDMNKTMKQLKGYVAALKKVTIYDNLQCNCLDVASFVESNKNAKKEVIKESADSKLFEMEQVSKEEFLETLKDKNKRNKFSDRYGLEVEFEEGEVEREIEEFNKILSQKRPVTKLEKEYYEKQGFINAFPALAKLVDSDKNSFRRKSFLTELFDMAENYIFVYKFKPIDPRLAKYDMTSLEGIAEMVRAFCVNGRYNDLKIVEKRDDTEMEKAVREYYRAQDNKDTTAKELEQKANAVWESYLRTGAVKQQEVIDKNKESMKNRLRILLPRINYTMARSPMSQLKEFEERYEVFAALFDLCGANSVNGEILRKEKDGFLKLYKTCISGEQQHKDNIEALTNALEGLLDKIWDAQIATIKEIRAEGRDHTTKDAKNQADFLDIMSTVMNRYTSKVVKSLGVFGSIKAKKALQD